MPDSDAAGSPWLRRLTADGPADADTVDAVGDLLAWVEGRVGGWSSAGGGYRAWFQGPPGSGKTRAAATVGRQSRKEVDRIDVPALIDGWSEGTEKEVASAFDAAAEAGRILLVAAGDGLFDRRTESPNANDRAANQQVAYLLQRIEDFPGLVILATNLRSHLDDAFARRWQVILRFPLAGAEASS